MDDEFLEGVLGREDMVVRDGQVLLVCSTCSNCAATSFPGREYCPRCSGKAEQATLPSRGTLWAYTIQGFPPKHPYIGSVEQFVPYGVGYIDLGGVALVEARLAAQTPDELQTGMPMELVLLPLSDSKKTYGFRPIPASSLGEVA